jgi:hypothetical protein
MQFVGGGNVQQHGNLGTWVRGVGHESYATFIRIGSWSGGTT